MVLVGERVGIILLPLGLVWDRMAGGVVVCGWKVSKGGGGPLTAASASSFCRVPAGQS